MGAEFIEIDENFNYTRRLRRLRVTLIEAGPGSATGGTVCCLWDWRRESVPRALRALPSAHALGAHAGVREYHASSVVASPEKFL